jgi:putative redox protein
MLEIKDRRRRCCYPVGNSILVHSNFSTQKENAMSGRRVRVAENGNGRFGQTVEAGRHRLAADEPETAGGLDGGPDPFAYVMAGLGACTTMTLRLYADRKGWPVGRLAVDVSHRRSVDAEGREADVIERILTVDGDLPPEHLDRLREIADRCPVGRMLARGATITTTVATRDTV